MGGIYNDVSNGGVYTDTASTATDTATPQVTGIQNSAIYRNELSPISLSSNVPTTADASLSIPSYEEATGGGINLNSGNQNLLISGRSGNTQGAKSGGQLADALSVTGGIASAIGQGVGFVKQVADNDYQVREDTPNFKYTSTGDKSYDASLERQSQRFQEEYNQKLDQLHNIQKSEIENRQQTTMAASKSDFDRISYVNRVRSMVNNITNKQNDINRLKGLVQDLYNDPAKAEALRKAYATQTYNSNNGGK